MRQEHRLTLLLKAAGLSSSTYHYQRHALAAEDPLGPLKARIRSIYEEHRGCYGYRRITAEIGRGGEKVNHKKVQRLMVAMGLKSSVRPKKYRAFRGESSDAAPNKLQRDFRAAQPNQRWVTDVTEFKIAGERLYLSPVLDLYNGEIVAYDIARRPLQAMISSMLDNAFLRLRKEDRPLLHSDQGWQYQMAEYRNKLAARNITQSMSRKGNCLDNAVIESFFGTLKSELFHQTRFDSTADLEKAIHHYIDYYNHHRIKIKLGGLSPVEYRTQAAQT